MLARTLTIGTCFAFLRSPLIALGSCLARATVSAALNVCDSDSHEALVNEIDVPISHTVP